MAAEQPPATFKLSDASLQLTLQSGQGLPERRLTLESPAPSVWLIGSKAQPFQLPAADLVAAINALHTMRFFQMPDQFGHRPTLVLRDDGLVGTQVLNMIDSGNTRLCFLLPDYRKCVSYQRDPPRELGELVQRLLSDAVRRIGPTTPGK